MIVVMCLHTLITGMTVMVILGFYDFLELFFLPEWSDYIACIFNGFKKQEMGAQI